MPEGLIIFGGTMPRTKFTLNSSTPNSYPTLNPALLIATEEPKHGRFLLSSTAFHGALLAMVAFLQIQAPARETIEIDLTDTPAPKIEPLNSPAALKGEPTAAPAEVSRPVPPTSPAAAKPVVHAAKPSTAPSPAAEPAEIPTAEPSFDPSALGNASADADTAPAFEAAELDGDFDDIQKEAASNEALASQNAFDAQAATFADESDVSARKLKAENLRAANVQKTLAAQNNRQALVKELAAGRAQERALANEKARRAAAAQAAAQARAAADARAAAERAAGERAAAAAAEAARARQGKNEGGDRGSAQGTVRSLADLKQVPGNERPRYSVDDRMAGRQGDVTVLAYVSRSGSIAQVRMPQSSGHRSLDEKTLQAIKTWKFYPGQEGWVEIPFRWDLKGGPQERPTTLRRKISQY